MSFLHFNSGHEEYARGGMLLKLKGSPERSLNVNKDGF